MPRVAIRFFFAQGTLNKPAAWSAICDWLEEARPNASVFVALDKKWLSLAKLRMKTARPLRHLNIETERRRPPIFEYPAEAITVASGSIARFDLDFLFIECPLSDLRDPVLEGLCQCGALILAGVFDDDYDRWQNAIDPQSYALAGRSLTDKTIVSNNTPPPLLRNVVDVSGNPGRWHYDPKGVPEMIAGRLWLGPELRRRLGTDRRAQLSGLTDFSVRPHANDLLICEWQGGLFDDATPAEVQDDLRRAIYGLA